MLWACGVFVCACVCVVNFAQMCIYCVWYIVRFQWRCVERLFYTVFSVRSLQRYFVLVQAPWTLCITSSAELGVIHVCATYAYTVKISVYPRIFCDEFSTFVSVNGWNNEAWAAHCTIENSPQISGDVRIFLPSRMSARFCLSHDLVPLTSDIPPTVRLHSNSIGSICCGFVLWSYTKKPTPRQGRHSI